MTIDEYENEVRNDIIDKASEYSERLGPLSRDNYHEWVDAASCDDDVTGFNSGSYYCSAAKAKDAIGQLIWDDALEFLLKQVGTSIVKIIPQGPETLDVQIRLAIVPNVVLELLENPNLLQVTQLMV